MQNNIPTLYILELDSFVVKSAKISTILCPFVQKKHEWKGQRLKKMYVRKITQHEENFLQLSSKGMIRLDFNMEHDEVYGKFVLSVCIYSILYFFKKFADCKKQTLLLFSEQV